MSDNPTLDIRLEREWAGERDQFWCDWDRSGEWTADDTAAGLSVLIRGMAEDVAETTHEDVDVDEVTDWFVDRIAEYSHDQKCLYSDMGQEPRPESVT